MRKLWHETAWKDYLRWQDLDKKTIKRINRLIGDIERNGYNGLGKPEPLKDDLSGYWSVRIDEKNRLLFRIADGVLEILECRSHYGDK